MSGGYRLCRRRGVPGAEPAAATDRLPGEGLPDAPRADARPHGADRARLDRAQSGRCRDRAGRGVGLCGRSSELPAGCDRDRGVFAHRAPPRLLAPPREAGGLRDERRLQCSRVGGADRCRRRRRAYAARPTRAPAGHAADDPRAGCHRGDRRRAQRGAVGAADLLRDDAGPCAVLVAEPVAVLHLGRRQVLPAGWQHLGNAGRAKRDAAGPAWARAGFSGDDGAGYRGAGGRRCHAPAGDPGCHDEPGAGRTCPHRSADRHCHRRYHLGGAGRADVSGVRLLDHRCSARQPVR